MRSRRGFVRRGLIGVVLAVPFAPAAAAPSTAKLQAVPFDRVRITDDFWGPRLEVNRTATLPHNLKSCEDTGRIANFARAARRADGGHEGAYFNDSDVYKVLEGAAYALALHPDKALEARIDAIIDLIAAAQQPDGYLNTYYTLKEPDKRWTDLPRMHELYCAGHLFEAAVAYRRATGKDTLLKVACRLADHIDSIFGPGKRSGYPGHEEIELALVKLYRETGQERYRRLAEFFVEARGQKRDAGEWWCQAHVPIREQSEIVGHAVRAMYCYSGAADVAALTGDRGLLDAMERLWQNVTGRKTYVTGGIGATSRHEAFGGDYELPNDTAYAETCAAIGLALWNHRLLMLHGEGRFGDVLERVLYNGALSGVSLDGTKFFYVNPLASRGQAHRQPWFGCACCPTNVVRFIPSIGGYLYATSDEGVWVNLYVGSTVQTTAAGKAVTLRQETKYPWEGHVRIAVQPAEPAEFAVHLRIPAWAERFAIKANGQDAEARPSAGYAKVHRRWQAGDVIDLDLPMSVRRVEAHPRVAANVGRVALQRGPIVCCLEAADHAGRVRNLFLPREAELSARLDPTLLGGVAVVEGQALTLPPVDLCRDLYRLAPVAQKIALKAVPYYAWDNRAAGEMVVWIPESPAFAETPLTPSAAAGAKVAASFCRKGLSPQAVNDGLVPAHSHDDSVPWFSWQDHKGTKEWIEYAFDKPQMPSGIDVYWLDDADQGGSCRVPRSWRLLWKKKDAWEPVVARTAYGVAREGWNHVDFEPVPVMDLRLEVELQDGFSGGILEWRVR